MAAARRTRGGFRWEQHTELRWTRFQACQSELELANLHKHCCKVAQDPMQAPRDKLYQDIAACSHKHSAGASHMTTPAPDGACLVHREALALAKMAGWRPYPSLPQLCPDPCVETESAPRHSTVSGVVAAYATVEAILIVERATRRWRRGRRLWPVQPDHGELPLEPREEGADRRPVARQPPRLERNRHVQRL